jgi:hypothetical protein
MGWASGSRLAIELIEAAKASFSNDDEREVFYEQLIFAFEEADCDTLDEATGVDDAFDSVWNDLYPSEDYDNDDDYSVIDLDD